MYNIVNVTEFIGGMKAGIDYIHGKWGRPQNYSFYYDAIVHSNTTHFPLPRFYLLLKDTQIVGCYALLTNDLISRQDLLPWLGCLFIEPSERGQALGAKLLKHGVEEAAKMGFTRVYLTTDHDGYYEKYGWERMEDGFNLFGEQGRIYTITT